MMENLDLSIEVLNAEAVISILTLDKLSDWVDEDRSLSDMVVLYWLSILTNDFDIHADLTEGFSLRYADSIFVYTFDNDLLEVAIPIRAEHHDLVKFDGSFEDGTTENETDTFGKVARINYELGRDFCLGWLNFFDRSEFLLSSWLETSNE